MRNKTQKEKAAVKAFGLTLIEREILEELKAILEMFHFASLEFQSNKVSISRVYPCVQVLRAGLAKALNDNKHTKKLAKTLLTSLNDRFGDKIEEDLYLVSAFLDPNFGIGAFQPDRQPYVKSRVKVLLKQMTVSEESTLNKQKKNHDVVEKRNNNYIFHCDKNNDELIPQLDDLDNKIDEYLNAIKHIGNYSTYE